MEGSASLLSGHLCYFHIISLFDILNEIAPSESNRADNDILRIQGLQSRCFKRSGKTLHFTDFIQNDDVTGSLSPLLFLSASQLLLHPP